MNCALEDTDFIFQAVHTARKAYVLQKTRDVCWTWNASMTAVQMPNAHNAMVIEERQTPSQNRASITSFNLCSHQNALVKAMQYVEQTVADRQVWTA